MLLSLMLMLLLFAMHILVHDGYIAWKNFQKFEGYIHSYNIVNNSVYNYQIDLFVKDEKLNQCVYHSNRVFNDYEISKLVAENKLGLRVEWVIDKETGECNHYHLLVGDYIVLTLIDISLIFCLICGIFKSCQESNCFCGKKYSQLSQQEEDNSIEMNQSV